MGRPQAGPHPGLAPGKQDRPQARSLMRRANPGEEVRWQCPFCELAIPTALAVTRDKSYLMREKHRQTDHPRFAAGDTQCGNATASMSSLCKKPGWAGILVLRWVSFFLDRPEAASSGGLIFFSSWTVWALPVATTSTAGRSPHARPVTVINFHGQASDSFLAGRAAAALVGPHWGPQHAGPAVRPTSGATSSFWTTAVVAATRLKATLVVLSTSGSPTVSSGLLTAQIQGPADHDLVLYDLDWTPPPVTWIWQPVPRLTTSFDDDHSHWDHHWGLARPSFDAAIAAGDVNTA